MQKLKAKLAQKNEKVNTSIRSYMRICLSSFHKYHPVRDAANSNQSLDKRVTNKVYSMVAKGTYSFNVV